MLTATRRGTLLFLLAACGSGSGSPTEEQEPPNGWSEPDRPWRPPEPTPDRVLQTEAHLGVYLPAEANAAQGHAYWLTGDEPIVLEAKFGFGKQFEPERGAVSLSILIDGVQIPFRPDGGHETHFLEWELERESSRQVSVQIDPHALASGAHSMMIAATWPHATWPIKLGLAYPIAIYRNSTDFDVDYPSPPHSIVPGTGPGSIVWVGSKPLQERLEIPADGMLRLRAELAGDWIIPVEEREVALVAFLGGRQVSFDQFGPTPVIVVSKGQTTFVDLVLKTDFEGEQTIDIFRLVNPRGLAELPDGSLGTSPELGILSTATLVRK